MVGAFQYGAQKAIHHLGEGLKCRHVALKDGDGEAAEPGCGGGGVVLVQEDEVMEAGGEACEEVVAGEVVRDGSAKDTWNWEGGVARGER